MVTDPEPKNSWILPRLDFRVDDLGHQGAELFFRQIPNPYDAMKSAVEASWKWLYGWNEGIVLDNDRNNHKQVIKPPLAVQRVKRITLTLRPMDGVAYTFGSDDGSEKEVHFSLKHIVNSYKGDTDDKKNARVREEILGVLTHEIVHCYQYNGQGTAPGGLIEGIADCVRLHAKLSPPHWKRIAPKGKHVPEPNGKWTWDWNWDAGYERTAYFLDWIDTTSETWSHPHILRDSEPSNAISFTKSAPSSSTSSVPVPHQISPSISDPSPPLGRGLFFRALNARLEEYKWDPEEDLFLQLTNWPRETLWEAYCLDNGPG
ncbi:peptidase of plants and bacteria-domain-containing protein [Lentinula edodes]|nr:peptidase of plants and bacteria-domain-containing protein [Lentinula edodes]